METKDVAAEMKPGRTIEHTSAVAAWAAPRVSPVSVMVIAAVPVAVSAAPPVVSTMVVLVDVALPEVAVKDATVLAMEATDPKK
jgi:hypothetical protein